MTANDNKLLEIIATFYRILMQCAFYPIIQVSRHLLLDPLLFASSITSYMIDIKIFYALA